MEQLKRRIDTIFNSTHSSDEKLQKVCQLLQDEISYYNWVGFYFRNGEKEELILGPYVGAETDHTIIPFGKGIVDFVSAFQKLKSMNFNGPVLIEMWNELDILYSQDTIVIPLLGSGTTRFKDYKISEQELLELILWTFKISKIKFTYPSKLIIVIHPSLMDKINLYKIKEEYKYVI